MITFNFICGGKRYFFYESSNGKAHLRTGHEGPEGEKRYSSTLPSASALEGMGGQRHALAALPPGKTRYPLYRKLFMNPLEPPIRIRVGLSAVWADYDHDLCSKDAGVII